jgi:hypothetical protein
MIKLIKLVISYFWTAPSWDTVVYLAVAIIITDQKHQRLTCPSKRRFYRHHKSGGKYQEEIFLHGNSALSNIGRKSNYPSCSAGEDFTALETYFKIHEQEIKVFQRAFMFYVAN